MADQENNKNQNTTAQKTDVDIAALLEKQRKEFEDKLETQKKEMQEKIDTMAEQNTKLNEELNNLKTNTAQENALLGEKIAKIDPKAEVKKYNPYATNIHYNVFNEEAKITTLMTGDEVECIVGLQDHITKKLIAGEKEFKKFPYIVKLVEKKDK